ncbi:hypothetical protein [Methylobacter sp. BBA5.1]|uniref:hypothetical protein n=1 Tax=Methylobacter sp. BBA5.1 TaxID=1495064 RepID=UPI000AFF8480|nr:hypothetical protein [Methylobacter sp. BBA5.1]
MPNWFAYAVLALWPLVAVRLYRSKSVTEATLWTILGGHMFLPVGTQVDLPMIPPLGKESIPALVAFFGCRFIAGRRISFIGQRGWVLWLLLLFILGPFVTAELNSDAVFVGGHRLPPMEHYDALSAVINQLIVIMPFFLGRQLFRTEEDHALLFRALIVAGLFYSLLMLLEVRMSPQLHGWLYGYFPHGAHSFGQEKRFGGFRPVVFMGHGLLVAFFAAVTVIAATVFWQLKIKVREFSSAKVTYYLLLVLLLCKSVASILYGYVAFLLIKVTSFKTQLRIAKILVLIALLYPNMSIMNIFPHQTLMNWTESMSAERAESLGFRFENEDMLLNHARQRLFFGWGGWGRNRVHNEETGRDMTVTDGKWIITLGTFGWLGFIAEFGLLALPVFRAASVFKWVKTQQEKILLSAHALLVGFVMIDQLPNASLAPWLWLLAGALLGRTDAILNTTKRTDSVQFA